MDDQPVEQYLKSILGKKAECKLTGMTGKIVSYCVYIFGSPKIAIQDVTLKDGAPRGYFWYELSQINIDTSN